MYIIFNKDGSVSESQLTDYINQHSDGVNYIDVSIVGKSVDEYTADGNFKLPNNEVVSLTGAFTNKIKTSTGVYEGYRITISAVVTEYQGDVALSIEAINSNKKTLFTYPVTLYVNETTGRGGDPITQDQYEALRAMMADYQLQYARSNMRSYDTLAEATEDLPNLSEGQMILAKETADSETSSVFQKVGDKLEGVSLDGLALDKFLRNKNAVGTGSFEWKVENQKYGYKNYFKIENGNQVTIAQEGGVDPTFTIGSGRFAVTLDKKGVTNDGLTIYWSNQILNQTGKPYYLDTRLLGKRNGVASLNENGQIPTYQLPSYVSDVLEFPSFDRFPTKGEVSKIYIALDTNKTYRWGGTVYVEIGSSLALGETSETAWAGDKGKENQDNIAKLQSDKVEKYKGALPPGYAVYGVNSSGGVNTEMMLLGTTIPNTVGQVVMTQTGGEIWGRSNQLDQAPSDNEFITKAYADKEYGGLASSNRWTSDNYFAGLTTLVNVSVVGGIGSDGGADFIALANDFSNELGQAFKKVTGFVSPYRLADITAYEAFGFVNENGLTDFTKASVLAYVSLTGRPRWIDLSTGEPTAYDYQLPKKSGTIALTSDLSEAGTSVTIRRW